MQQRSVADLVSDEFGMADLVKRSPGLMAAARVIDATIAEQMETPPVDGLYREVGACTLMDRAESLDVKPSDVQFVLNALSKDVYSFGGRSNGTLLDSAQVVGLMRAVAFAARDGTSVPPEAHDAVAVHRFTAASVEAKD